MTLMHRLPPLTLNLSDDAKGYPLPLVFECAKIQKKF